ncbi:TonB-dependent receptor [Acinetobacter bouvetii]|nr:TonB-dependent siderophore receptor [Acinetobacter bouvetii]
MHAFSKKILGNSISLIMLGGVATQLVQANTALPTITLQAEADTASYAAGKLAQNTQLGALGNQKIIDTPFSVVAYTEKLIEEQQASTVAQVLKNDASIRMTTNQGHLYENFQIRGFGVHGDEIALNGLYGMAPVSRAPAEMLGGVTVLKGPNALVAGMAPNGGVGGVINITPKRADDDLTRITSTFEDQSYYQSHLDISRRFGTQKQFGVRSNLVYGQGERNMDGEEDKKALGSIAADYTTDKLQLNLDAYALKENRADGSPAMVAFTKMSTPKVLKAPEGGLNHFNNLDTQIDSKFVGLNAKYALNQNWNIFGGLGYADKTYDGFVFGTRMIVKNTNGDADSQTFNQYSNFKNTTANLGTDYKLDTGEVDHQIGLRADYLKVKSNQHKPATTLPFATNLYQSSKDAVMSAEPVIAPNNNNTFISYTLTDQMSMLDDKLQLILGLRYQDMDINTSSSSYSENALSPSIGVVVKPFGDNVSFYANYVEGLSQGDTVSNEKDVNWNQTFAPFIAKQYEMGTKIQTGSWLNTFALYQIEKESSMTEAFKQPDANGHTQITTGGAETRSRGVEWSFSGELLQGLNVLGNMAYIDSEYVKAVKNQGNEMYGLPDLTATLGVDYKLPVLEGLNVNARVNYVGKQYLNATNTLELPDFTTIDLGARYKTSLAGVDTTFVFNIDNIANTKYWEGVFQDGYAIVGADRSYKFGVSFDF